MNVLLIVALVIVGVGAIVLMSKQKNARHPSSEVTPPVVEPDRDPGNVSPGDKINGS